MNDSLTITYRIENKTLSILMTTKCNHKCITCPQKLNIDSENHDKELDDFIRHVSFHNIKEVYLTGGEPMLKMRYIEKLLLKTPSRINFTILTNGSIIPSEKIVESNRCKLCVPLFASYDELHNLLTGSRSFYKVVSNLIQLSNYNIPIELRFVMTKLNYQNLQEFSRFVHRNLPFVQNVAFMGIELMEMAAINKNELWVDPRKYISCLEKAVDYLSSFEIPVSIYNLQPCLFSEKYRVYLYNSISEWKREYLPVCLKCQLRGSCGGIFFSDLIEYNKII